MSPAPECMSAAICKGMLLWVGLGITLLFLVLFIIIIFHDYERELKIYEQVQANEENPEE